MAISIVSWNTQGDGLNRLEQSYGFLRENGTPTAILVQEAGPLPTDVDCAFDGTDYTGYFVPEPGAKNPRCTTGILVKADLASGGEFRYYKFNEYKRPLVCFVHDEKKIVIATLHSDATERRAINQIHEANVVCQDTYSNYDWILMGDFNCEPQNALDENDDLSFNVIHGNFPTHQSGKILDYAICSDSLNNKAKIVSPTNVPNQSDHYPIICILDKD